MSTHVPQELAQALAAAADRLGRFAGRVRWYDEIASTNTAAVELAAAGAPAGTVLVADRQTAGRGRVGRTWESPAGAGLYVSAVVHPARESMPLVTLAAGVAIADAIRAATGLDVQVKWPNDIYIGDRKVAGILAEAGTGEPGRSFIVIGFGINVLPASLPADVAARATSLEGELGRTVDRGLLLTECLASLHDRLRQLDAGQTTAVVAAWRARAALTFGRPVEFDDGPQAKRGVVIDVGGDGALLVDVDGARQRVVSGEVRWL